MRALSRALVTVALGSTLLAPTTPALGAQDVTLTEFTVSKDAMCDLTKGWQRDLARNHPAGTWAPLEVDLTDEHLARLGLPSSDVLRSRRYPQPTLVTRDGRALEVSVADLEAAMASEPTVATYAGIGCVGIRPGAWLLLIQGGSIGWCSMAHVYGSPGSYDISTAGHCGKTGDTATVIAALGNRDGVAGAVLLDFGRFAQSHDGGLGNDWALIDILPQYQGLVSPTMCFWGGPRGTYTKTGALVGVSFPGNSIIPDVTVTPDPLLAQGIAHYGHGAAIGAGGTPRAGTAIHWGPTHFMFEGAIAPGDSGSGANTLLGDTVGANMEAAGIITHIWIDPLMREGVGIMGGTRATQVSGSLADGQIVPYPVPAPGLP